MIGVKAMNILSGLLAMSVMLSACAAPPPSIETDTTTMIQTQVFTDSLNTVKQASSPNRFSPERMETSIIATICRKAMMRPGTIR